MLQKFICESESDTSYYNIKDSFADKLLMDTISHSYMHANLKFNAKIDKKIHNIASNINSMEQINILYNKIINKIYKKSETLKCQGSPQNK